MSKELIKEALGITHGGREYDMRPRFDADTYIKILKISKQIDMKPNPTLRALAILAIRMLEEESSESARNIIIELQAET